MKNAENVRIPPKLLDQYVIFDLAADIAPKDPTDFAKVRFQRVSDMSGGRVPVSQIVPLVRNLNVPNVVWLSNRFSTIDLEEGGVFHVGSII